MYRRLPRGARRLGRQARGYRIFVREARSWGRLCRHAALLRRGCLYGVVPSMSGQGCVLVSWLHRVCGTDGACWAGITIPILPGIMPIQNYQSFRRMTNLCKSHIPAHIVTELELIEVR